MREGKPFEGVLDIARRENGKQDVDFTGVFEPDAEAVEAWATPLSQEYNGEFRYFNKSPMELRRLLLIEENQSEIDAINAALEYRKSKSPSSGIVEAGEPYRGEPREVATPVSIIAMARDRNVVEHVYSNEGMRRDSMDVGVPVGKAVRGLEKIDGLGLNMVETVGGMWEEM